MTISKKKGYFYCDNQGEIMEIILAYSKSVGYESEYYADAICSCKNNTFQLFTDEVEGVAVRTCSKCKSEHPIGDSAEYLEDAELEKHECLCGNDSFEITAGVSLYQNSNDVKWLYIGCRCPSCKLVGCYADWKNEFEDYKKFLKMI